MTMRTYKDTFLCFFSGLIDASRSDVKLLFGRVSMMKVEISEISIVPADTTFSSVLGNQDLFYLLPFYPRFFRDQFAMLTVIYSLILRCTQLAVISMTKFGRMVSVKISEWFWHSTHFTFSLVHNVNTY